MVCGGEAVRLEMGVFCASSVKGKSELSITEMHGSERPWSGCRSQEGCREYWKELGGSLVLC